MTKNRDQEEHKRLLDLQKRTVLLLSRYSLEKLRLVLTIHSPREQIQKVLIDSFQAFDYANNEDAQTAASQYVEDYFNVPNNPQKSINSMKDPRAIIDSSRNYEASIKFVIFFSGMH